MARDNHGWDLGAVIQGMALDELGNGVAITDRHANILYVNKAFEAITGYASAEVLGRNMSLLKSGHQSKEFYAQMWTEIQGGGQWDGTLWNKRKDGEAYHERLRIRRFTDPVGDVYYVAAFADIGEQDELQRALIDAQKRELMATLIGGLVHDFNNYMAAIQGFASLGQRASADDKVLHYFSEVIQASKRASDLVKGLKKVSSVSRTQQEAFDPMTAMRDALETAASVLPKSIELIVKIPDMEACQIKGSSVDIEQVLLNLFTNARDALEDRDDAWIKVEVMKSQKSLEHCQRYCPRTLYCPVNTEENLVAIVEDNGAGIPEDIQEKIFNPFFTTKGEKGSGLGLASVDQIVSQLGGAVWVTSQMDVGTRFHLCLPILPRSDAPAAAAGT